MLDTKMPDLIRAAGDLFIPCAPQTFNLQPSTTKPSNLSTPVFNCQLPTFITHNSELIIRIFLPLPRKSHFPS